MTIQKNSRLITPIVKVWYAIVDLLDNEVASIEENIIDGTVSVNFEEGHSWKEIYTTKESHSFEDAESFEKNGSLYNQKLIVNHPGDGAENQKLLKDLNQRPLIIRMQQLDGYYKLLGTIDNPVFINVGLSSVGMATGRELRFFRESAEPAPFIV